MIPSTVAAEVTDALKDFLATGFSPSNPALANVVDDFLADTDNLAKGPYLSLDLPFQPAPEGGEPFPEIPFGHTPHRHQRVAFGRLARGQSTIVATGTGSGKTECFLYPVLEHCRTHAGEPGIKAILIYPMNALASDQARRIADIIHNTPSLSSRVTAGLYVGEGGALRRERMTPDHLIENRDVLRQQPPDILLTNYKMLDLLLTRPIDFPLWRHNAASTLRFLVVDELHTFDGAQGTDLACLVRRLRTRLQADEGLVCVGTSATIGGQEDEQDVLRYASRVFRQPFAPGAVVGEVRQGIDEFLKDAIISSYLTPTPNLAQRVDPNGYDSLEDYIRAQHELFFGELPEGDFESLGWRIRLGERLREHATFVNLLRVLDGSKPTAFSTVLSRLQRALPTSNETEAKQVLNALCALISVARERGKGEQGKPTAFLNVKLHVWIRELRRMVCSLFDEATDYGTSNHRLRHSDDLKPDQDGLHLPLVQCRECHATGWAFYKPSGSLHVDRDLRVFYNRFFRRDRDVNYAFPLLEGESPPKGTKGQKVKICGHCGYVAQPDASSCPGCGQQSLVRVYRPNAASAKGLSTDCVYCGASNALIILGARASSLLSTALTQLFASRHNDDHKVIAFSDNVQDAAHRGSFFAARTWRNSLRAAMAQVIAKEGNIPLADYPDQVVAWWGKAEVNAKAFEEIRFITEFIAPDRLWFRDFEALRRDGELPENSTLRSLVERRMRWDVLAEMTWRAAIGRTLERTYAAAVGFDREALLAACEQAGLRIREEFGELRSIDEAAVRALVLGVVRRMRDRGAVQNAALEGYLGNGGRPYAIQDPALQDFGGRSNLPVFPAPVAEDQGIEALAGGSSKSWYRVWAEKVLTPVNVLAASQEAAAVLQIVMTALHDSELVCVLPGKKTQVWALDPQRLHVTSQAALMSCPSSRRTLVVSAEEADLWQGAPCLDLATQENYAEFTPGQPTWSGQLYRDADIRRIVSAEHTALVPRQERDQLQERFAADERKPWDPNLLSATPTLELGVDIGSLSSVIMCSVPPAAVNYVQRTGRAGRRDGNALAMTVATGQPHDLYYYAEPMEMLGSRVEPPGVFLNAPAVLERQLTAFCFDCWVAKGVDEQAVPRRIGAVLDNVDKENLSGFPYPLFDFIAENGDRILSRFFQAFQATTPVQDEGGTPSLRRTASNEGRSEGILPSDGAKRRSSTELDEASQDYLRRFLHGADSEDSLRLRILKRLTEVVNDRKSLRSDVEALRNRIRALERTPSDEATEAEIKALKSERAALQSLLSNLNGRDTFGFLTDEGLLPNYAFPEQGVTLNSVIFRHTDGQDDASEDDRIVYDYLRPAVAALGEFAPENEFYAGGRKVAIRRIDMRGSPIEWWRLCPSCAYCENIDAGDHHATCPRCGDPLWADAGQRREMLRLRLVHAATPDRRSRIMDDRDEREPLFYTRQLVADFPPDSVSRAYAATDAAQPFGFEYIPSATFREMNFGRRDEQDSPTAFAGEVMPRKGFSLCRKCGGVQGQNGEVQHTRTCGARSEEAIVDCLYLYRDFKSEAVRILIPAVGTLDAEQRTSSFIAALELGLRRQFAGAVDHLRVMTCKFPAAESGVEQTFLMLYDTVPGGTGYLKQMMGDPNNLLEVLRRARDAIAQCECNADPMKDGCYRCVYAYRRSYDMEGTSRTVALALLNEMLEGAFSRGARGGTPRMIKPEDLQEVPGLRTVKTNPLMESELEARFVEALRRIEVEGKPVRVREDIVGGKPGFALSVDERTYFMEPQADLGRAQGVVLPSRPDFLIRPARASTGSPPVAVFMDGFEHHRDRADDDSAKRMALVRAGYLVWSLTWQDINDAFGNGAPPLAWLGGNEGAMTALQEKLDQRWETDGVRSALGEPSLNSLVRFLRNPDPLAWKRALFTQLLGLFQRADMQSAALRNRFLDAAKQLPAAVQDRMADLPEETALAGAGPWRNGTPELVELFVALPLAAVQEAEPDAMAVALHLNDAQPEHSDYRRQWNDTLRFYNLAQFLPGASWTTVRGTTNGIYPEYPDFAEADALGEMPDAAWTEAVSLAVAALRPILLALAEDELPPPEVGFELQDAAGEVVAEAELAWEAKQVAVLLDGAESSAFTEAGWLVLSADEANLESQLRTVLSAEESS